MNSGSNRKVYICEDDPDMVCKQPIDDRYKSVQEAEIESYRNYGKEYEMFCPIDLKNSSVQNIYMRRADVIADVLWKRYKDKELDRATMAYLIDEWDDECIYRNEESLRGFYSLAEETCETIYGNEGKIDGEWLEEELDKLLEGDGEPFRHLFADFHSGNYGFITGPEGKHRIVCIDYAGTW